MEEAEIEDKSEQHSIKVTELETCSKEVNKSNGRITGKKWSTNKTRVFLVLILLLSQLMKIILNSVKKKTI